MTILERLQNYINDDNNKYYGYEISSHDAKEIVKALQFQQNVVRCGECKLWYSYPNDKHCSRHISKVCDDGFCFEGKRRDEE